MDYETFRHFADSWGLLYMFGVFLMVILFLVALYKKGWPLLEKTAERFIAAHEKQTEVLSNQLSKSEEARQRNEDLHRDVVKEITVNFSQAITDVDRRNSEALERMNERHVGALGLVTTELRNLAEEVKRK